MVFDVEYFLAVIKRPVTMHTESFKLPLQGLLHTGTIVSFQSSMLLRTYRQKALL